MSAEAILHEDVNARIDTIVENARARDQKTIDRLLSQLQREKRKLHLIHDLLENAVVIDPRDAKKFTTLWTLVENAEFRLRCPRCEELECEGCEVQR